MSITTSPARSSSRARKSHNGRLLHTNFTRQMVIAEFGWRFAKALDQTDFVDRAPGQLPHPSPEAPSR